MKTVKVTDLDGSALDWAVDKVLGKEKKPYRPSYSTSWEHAGPIITRERISLWAQNNHWVSQSFEGDVTTRVVLENTSPLIAAMRCYCCAKLGEFVYILEELLCQKEKI